MSVASAAGWGFRTSRSYPWESPRSWPSPGPHRIAGPSRCVNSTATGVIHGGRWPATGAVASAVAPGSPPCDPGAGAGADEAPACLILSTRCAQSSARPSIRVGGWGAAPGQGERESDRPAPWPSPRGFGVVLLDIPMQIRVRAESHLRCHRGSTARPDTPGPLGPDTEHSRGRSTQHTGAERASLLTALN